MALDSKICCFIYLLTTVYGLEISDLELDKTLNPRLVGAVYHLYKPVLSNNKGTPITIDCNHPSVICKFGTSALVTSTNKECNCKDSAGEVPIIAGLTTGENNKDKPVGVIKTEGDTVTFKAGDSDVPIYKGVVDTDAILNEADNPYNIWNFQRNSLDKGWRPVDDPTKTRVGELPRKFYSYYPFSQPPATDDFSMNFPPSMSGQPHFHPNWHRPGATASFPSGPPPLHRGTKPQFPTSTVKNSPITQNLKTNSFPKEVYPIADKVSAITPKSIPKNIDSAENSKSEESSTSKP